MWLEILLVVSFFTFLVLGWVWIKIIIYRMAEARILLLTVREGEAVAVMVGDKLDRIIMNMKGHNLDSEYNVIEKESADMESITRIFPGVYWLGLPGVAKVYRYPFTWTKLDGLTGKPNSRTEIIEQIYVKSYQYLFSLESSETFSMAAVSIPFLVTINVINPYTALFKNDKWLDLVSSAVLDEARKFIASLDDPNQIMQIAKGVHLEDENLKKKLPRDEKGNETITSFGEIILYYLKKDKTLERLEKRVGARISVIDVPSVDLGNWASLAIAEIEARKQGDALVATAEAKAKALRIQTDAEVMAYGKVAEALGPEFYVVLKKIENITAASKAGTTVLYDTGGIKDFLQKSAASKGIDSRTALDAFVKMARDRNLELPAEFGETK